MIKQDEIKKLIESGFDLELISFELDIPLEQVKQCKEDLGKAKLEKREIKSEIKSEDAKKRRNSYEFSKMEQIRRKYEALFFTSNTPEIKKQKQLSKEELELVETTIATIEENIQEVERLSGKEKKQAIIDILSQIKKIENYELPIEQAERIIDLISSEELRGVKVYLDENIDYSIGVAKKRMVSKLSNAINMRQAQTENLEELKTLREKLTPKLLKENYVLVGGVQSAITRKIANIEQQAMIKAREDIPNTISTIITGLASGKIDIELANKVINEEAKKEQKNSPKTQFSLTEEQYRNQILIQIRTAIRERTDRYNVEKPEQTILLLHKLCGGELHYSVTAVVKHLIAKKDYKTAKDICDNYRKKEKDPQMVSCVWGLKNDAKRAEISDLILRGIRRKGTVEEDTRVFELIETGLEKAKLDFKTICLGKSEDGLRNISLADIWPGEKQKTR